MRITPLHGPDPDHPTDLRGQGSYVRWSTAMQSLSRQQTKNLLVSYAPQKLGFF
ncbi:hypothetical protein OHA27_34965 [Streptomyces sp. NBC_01619]|uniref:hypothetical protein n=1 Tax=Streptomyces sp. NBC_01619 TaxID=2975901 RepID=UPI00224DAE80|nr:hypothetical protein [Streptomyces sp. NBC_01619]MCX4515431.1 hypothetical protein [Streptomyces sp. NBC_01619]